MIPLLALVIVAAHPQLAIDFTVVRRVQVDLIAIITLVVLDEAFIAEGAEADLLLR